MQRVKNEFYHFLAERLCKYGEKRGNHYVIKRKKAKEILVNQRVPKRLLLQILSNMEKLGLIKTENKRTIKILIK